MMTFGLGGLITYFMFAPGVHENHLFWAMLLAFVLWSRLPHLRAVAIGLAIYGTPPPRLAITHGFQGAMIASWISASLRSPRQMTTLPGGGSEARAR